MIDVLLPAYNESRSLRALVPLIHGVLGAQAESHRVIVVNDGSRDETSTLLADLARRGPVHEVLHPINRGYGAALGSGYGWVLNQPGGPDDVIVSLDADGTHGPEFIPALVQRLRAGYDIVTASYDMPGGSVTGVPPYRRLLSRSVNGLFRVLCAVPGARTYSNGFRVYRRSIVEAVASRFGGRLIEDAGFAGGAELFLKAAAAGGRAAEAPFDLHYERRGKDSKIRFAPTILGYLRLIRRARGGFAVPL